MTISPKYSTKLIIAFIVSLRQQQKLFLNPISKCFTNTVGNGQCENGLTPTLQAHIPLYTGHKFVTSHMQRQTLTLTLNLF